MTPSKITVIVPTLNEAHNMSSCVSALGSGSDFELIVVDGGSSDDTVKLSMELGARVFRTSACRATQMNLGARESSNDIFVFLHADTRLPHDWREVVTETLLRPGVSVGAFRFSLDDDRWQFRAIEKLANFRSNHFGMPYGDQAIFVTRENFYRLNGYPEIFIMEDFAFCRAARRTGLVMTAPSRAVTSSRRWKQRGILKTMLINQLIIALFFMGVSDRTLRRIYDSAKQEFSSDY